MADCMIVLVVWLVVVRCSSSMQRDTFVDV